MFVMKVVVMRRIMLVVAYDGTNYSGWQLQPETDTIEGQLNKALSGLLKETIVVCGASRTDAGVHSMGNVAVFDTESRIPAEKLAVALNARLPEDIIVQSSRQVRSDFHPRRCSCIKTYEYRIYNARMENPQLTRYTWHRYGDVDVEAMQKAADLLIGEHDFTSFCAAGSTVESKIRTITKTSVCRESSLIRIRISGSGFLYNMVRIIAGTLMLVGIHRLLPEDILTIIEAKDRRKAGPTAPAKGLTQIGIEYDEALLSAEDCEGI